VVGRAYANLADFSFEKNSFGFNTLKLILCLRESYSFRKEILCSVKEIKIIVFSLFFLIHTVLIRHHSACFLISLFQ